MSTATRPARPHVTGAGGRLVPAVAAGDRAVALPVSVVRLMNPAARSGVVRVGAGVLVSYAAGALPAPAPLTPSDPTLAQLADQHVSRYLCVACTVAVLVLVVSGLVRVVAGGWRGRVRQEAWVRVQERAIRRRQESRAQRVVSNA